MTNQEQQNLVATQLLYDATGRGDWDATAAMLTDDFFITEAPGLPFAGVYSGRNALRDLFTKVMGMMEVTGLDLQQMLAGGDWVMVLLDIVAHDTDGSEIRIPIAEGTRFRDGKACEIKPYYFDPALVHRAVAAKQIAA